jgi:hypothetical protein
MCFPCTNDPKQKTKISHPPSLPHHPTPKNKFGYFGVCSTLLRISISNYPLHQFLA